MFYNFYMKLELVIILYIIQIIGLYSFNILLYRFIILSDILISNNFIYSYYFTYSFTNIL